MSKLIKKLLKIKVIKVSLCILENLIKLISIKLRQKIEHKLYNAYDFGDRNVIHTEKLYKKIKTITKKLNFNLKDIRVLELGPGGFLGVGAFLKQEGIREYNIIDNINHFEKLDHKVAQLYKQIDKTVLKGSSFDKTYIKQLSYKNNHLPLEDNSVNLIFSNAVYEHVEDPETSIKELARVTKQGGLSIHTIDFRDHIFNQKSISFLYIPSWIFNGLFKRAGAWVNRKRYDDFVYYFNNSGFKIIDTIIDRSLNKKKLTKQKRLFKKYGKENLSKLAVTFVCKKV